MKALGWHAVLWAFALTAISWAGDLPSAATWGAFASGARFLGRQRGILTEMRHSRADSSHSYDALSYVVDAQLEFGPPAMWHATVTMDFRCVEDLGHLSFHLRGYQINLLQINGFPCQYTRTDDVVQADLGTHPLQAGDSARLSVTYSGTPVWENGLGLSVGGQIAYTLSDPWGTRNWLACFDEPFDKARWAVNLQCDSTFAVLANGDLTGVTPHEDGTATWSHRHDVPMSSYLVSVVCGRLRLLEDSWQGLPMRWFVYPQHVAQAWQAVSRKDAMFACFSGLWGSYPFASYAMGEAPIYGGMGGMEHQTCTTIGSGILAGGLAYESIIAHELSHMWWGDSVTPVDFQHVWLNEGWATYAEAYFYQHLAGGNDEAFMDYLGQLQQTYLNWDSQFEAIFDPPDDNLFTVNQYEKAACVLHMLRKIMGDEAFHEAQRQWQADHRYGTVNTAEYQAAMESASGQDLAWFFQQWIYTGGYPTYRTVTESRNEGDSCRVHLTVNQSHPRLDSFRAPVPLRLVSSTTTLDTLIWVEAASSQFSWRLPGLFDTLIFNHQHPVLCRHETVPATGGTPLWRVIEVQLDDSVGGNGDGDLAAGEWAWLGLVLENVGGWDSQVDFSFASEDLNSVGQWPRVEEVGGGTLVQLPLGRVALSGVQGAHPAWAQGRLLSSSAHYPAQSLPFSVPVGDPWLALVLPAGQEDVAPWVQRELDSLACFTDGEVIVEQAIPQDLLPNHRALLWLSGDAGNCLMDNQFAWIENQLALDPCTVMLSGQDVVDSLSHPWTLAGLEVLHADVADRLVDGAVGSSLEGRSALLLGAGGAGNQVDPSSLMWQDGATDVQTVARYRGSQEPAMVLIGFPNGSRLLVAGFGLEAISGMAGTNSRRQWLEALVPLLDLSSPVPISPAPAATSGQEPSQFHLGQIFPNPANGQVSVDFVLRRPSRVQLEIFDVAGQWRATLLQGQYPVGEHQATLDLHALPSGQYFIRMTNGTGQQARKLLLVK